MMQAEAAVRREQMDPNRATPMGDPQALLHSRLISELQAVFHQQHQENSVLKDILSGTQLLMEEKNQYIDSMLQDIRVLDGLLQDQKQENSVLTSRNSDLSKLLKEKEDENSLLTAAQTDRRAELEAHVAELTRRNADLEERVAKQMVRLEAGQSRKRCKYETRSHDDYYSKG